jgi:hypothetical protein
VASRPRRKIRKKMQHRPHRLFEGLGAFQRIT